MFYRVHSTGGGKSRPSNLAFCHGGGSTAGLCDSSELVPSGRLWGTSCHGKKDEGRNLGSQDCLAPDGSTPESKALFNRCGAEGQPGRVVTLGPREGWAVMLLKRTLGRPVSGSTLHRQRRRVQAPGPTGAGLPPAMGASAGSATVPRPGYLAPCGLSPTDQDPRALHHRTLLFPLLTYISGFGFLFCFLIN